jgi:hypothetical protein
MITTETAAPCFDSTAVIVTDELFARPRGETDPSALLEQIVALVRCVAENPGQLAPMLVEAVHRFTRAGSVGLSLEDIGASELAFRWIALSGRFANYLGGTMPRHFSPCGTVVDADRPMSMRDAMKCFAYIHRGSAFTRP